jgi:hypothetical protein
MPKTKVPSYFTAESVTKGEKFYKIDTLLKQKGAEPAVLALVILKYGTRHHSF